MSVERQLADYRARKARDQQSQPRTNILGTAIFGGKESNRQLESVVDRRSEVSHSYSSGSTYTSPAGRPRVETRHSKIAGILRDNQSILTNTTFLKFVLWLILWGVFIQLEFGAVYFVLSSLAIIYYSMKSGSRDPNAPSAYSVFNPNCERLEGTFTAEQFEHELRHGIGSVQQ